MALKAKLTSLDGLSEDVKKLYKQVDDHYVLDVESVDGYSLEDVSGLKSTLGKNKTEITELKAKVAAIGDLDPAAAREALEKVKEFGTLKPEEMAKEKVRAALDQANAQFKTQLEAKDAEVSGLTRHLTSVMIDQAATAALAAKGGNVRLLLPHVKSSAKVVKTDSGFAVQVVDTEGHPRIVANKGGTSDMTLEQLVDEMSASTDFAAAFSSSSRSGGGSQSGNGGGGNGRPKTISANDQAAVNASIEDIASGKAVVNLDSN